MMNEEKIIKEIEKEEHKVVKSIRNNPWIMVSIVLGVIVLILLIIFFRGGIAKNIISADIAGERLTASANAQGVDATLVGVKDNGQFYEVTISIKGQNLPLYVTKDGKFFTQALISLTGDPVMRKDGSSSNNVQNSQKDVQKTDKPIIEAFIFSYCPYGLQFEKALFPVYDLLKDKTDFRIVAIGAMHGEFERIETLRQISIEKLYNTAKLFSYLKEFNVNTNIGSCNGDDACLNKYLPTIYSKLGIDKTKVENYMKSDAGKIYNEQNARANELGVSGSPTFVINDAQVQVSRSPDAIKEAVCNSFNTKPEECSKTLSTSQANPGFG